MKVIKRDGRAVDYDRQKIVVAISKANEEVLPKEKATKDNIKGIIEYIEALDKKRMLVEDIQDIIEQQLMELKKYDLAKKYIVYRYTRQLVRKQNTTDESILGIIRNESNNEKDEDNTLIASNQRNYIAGEVSRDLTKRLLLPEKITKADEEGILYFHNSEYFIQPIINSSYINLEDMLENGTIINDYKINYPETFLEACIKTVQIILEVANNQYGMQIIDITCLGKYLKENHSEARIGINYIKSLLSTILVNGRLAEVKFIINLNSEQEYFEENMIISKEIERVKFNNTKKIKFETYDSEIKKEYLPIFDQGKVSINLAQIAINADGDAEKFWQDLDERLELCKEALMYKHYALLGTNANISPILWRYGGIARLENGDKIDELLNNGISTLSLGYVGIYETVNLIKGNTFSNNEKEEFVKKIKGKILDIIKKWKEETGLNFVLKDKNSEKICQKFLKIDKERFGTIKGITDKERYELNKSEGEAND